MISNKKSKYTGNSQQDWSSILNTPMKFVDLVVSKNWRDPDSGVKTNKSGKPILHHRKKQGLSKTQQYKFYYKVSNDMTLGQWLTKLSSLSGSKLMTTYSEVKNLFDSSMGSIVKFSSGEEIPKTKSGRVVTVKFIFGADSNEIYFKHDVKFPDDDKKQQYNERYFEINRTLHSYKSIRFKNEGVDDTQMKLDDMLSSNKEIKKAKHIKSNSTDSGDLNISNIDRKTMQTLLYRSVDVIASNIDCDLIVNTDVPTKNILQVETMSAMLNNLKVGLDDIIHYMENHLNLKVGKSSLKDMQILK